MKMDNDDILDVVSDFLYEKDLVNKFSKWVEKQDFEDDEEYDLKDWIGSLPTGD